MPAKVNDVSDEVKAMQSRWSLVDALIGGTWAMRQARETYLHKWPQEDQHDYDYRLKNSTLFNAFGRTIDNMAAKPFSEPIKWTDIAPDVAGWFDNIDLAGRNIDTFGQEVFRAGLIYGLTHILVEYPVTAKEDGTKPTLAEERIMGARPFVVHVLPSSILGWLSEKVAGVETLTQLRILEVATENDGLFGTKSIQQVRVLVPGGWAIFRKNPQSDEWAVHDKGVTTLKYIPLVTFYTRRTGFMQALPPLSDLADLNVQHWNSSSDQYSILHTARVPILAITGIDDMAKVVIGAKSALMLPVGATAGWVEHSGAAIDSGRVSLQDLEEQMRTMGAELLVAQPGDMTATQSSIDTAQAQCQLSAMAKAFEDVLDQVVDIMADYAGMGPQGDIDVFDDFAESPVTAASIQPFVAALTTAVASNLLSQESAFAELQRYSIINPDLEWDDEQERIQSQGPSLGMLGVTDPFAKADPAIA